MARPAGPARPGQKSEGLGAKIWPDGRVWAYNKWPDFFGTGLGFAFGPRAGPARPEIVVCLHIFLEAGFRRCRQAE